MNPVVSWWRRSPAGRPSPRKKRRELSPFTLWIKMRGKDGGAWEKTPQSRSHRWKISAAMMKSFCH